MLAPLLSQIGFLSMYLSIVNQARNVRHSKVHASVDAAKC